MRACLCGMHAGAEGGIINTAFYKQIKEKHVSLSIGIVGLPNVGKSSLFTALTKKSGFAANYPFATIEPNVGIVPVPDDR